MVIGVFINIYSIAFSPETVVKDGKLKVVREEHPSNGADSACFPDTVVRLGNEMVVRLEQFLKAYFNPFVQVMLSSAEKSTLDREEHPENKDYASPSMIVNLERLIVCKEEQLPNELISADVPSVILSKFDRLTDVRLEQP